MMPTQTFIEDIVARYAMDLKTVVCIYVTKNELATYNNLMIFTKLVIITCTANPQLVGQWTTYGAVKLKTDYPLKEGTFGIELDDSPIVEIFDFKDWKEFYD